MSLIGTWHIYEMENWDEEYFNAEVQAYIQIEKNLSGSFHFGYVEGDIDCELENPKKISFTFEGMDENDPCSGRGHLEVVDINSIKGRICFHDGDKSDFLAKRAKKK